MLACARCAAVARGSRLAAAALAAVLLLGCGQARPPDTATSVTIATGRTGGSFHTLGTRLAQIYNDRLSGIRATALEGEPAELVNADAIQRGTVDLAFIGGDNAYTAYRRGTQKDTTPHTRLRAIAVLYSSAVQILALGKNGIRHVRDLRGRRFAIADFQGGQTDETSRAILEAYGLEYDDLHVTFSSVREMADLMRDDRLDGGLTFAAIPQSPILDVARTGGLRLIPIERHQIELIQARYPFLKSITIPAGTYEGQSEDVMTVGIDNLLVCREDLPPPLVRTLTQAFLEALPELGKAHPAAGEIDPDRAPATPIPLHPGAAQYYRERQLAR